jgi:hypothetical protein
MNYLAREYSYSRFWQALFAGVSCLPWLWLALMVLFVAAVSLQVGHLPTYGRPDPKDTAYLLVLYWPVLLLWSPTAIAPILWSLLGLGKHFFELPFIIRRQEVVTLLTGWALFLWLVLTDFGGLMTWLID